MHAGRSFTLSAMNMRDRQTNRHQTVALRLRVTIKEAASITMQHEFSASQFRDLKKFSAKTLAMKSIASS